MSSLFVTYDNDLELSGFIETLELGFERQEHSMNVIVDGSPYVSHFSVSCDQDWVVFHRVMNSITIVVNENTTPRERFATMVFKHNMDRNSVMRVNIRQAKPEYSVNAMQNGLEVESVQFSTLLGVNDPERESEALDIKCLGGLRDYRVRVVNEYAKVSDESGYRIVPYDGGLKTVKVGTDRLWIVNYGKISPYDDMYYDVVLSHRNDMRSTKRIKVTYV